MHVYIYYVYINMYRKYLCVNLCVHFVFSWAANYMHDE